jgi:hypothetical protein
MSIAKPTVQFATAIENDDFLEKAKHPLDTKQ